MESSEIDLSEFQEGQSNDGDDGDDGNDGAAQHDAQQSNGDAGPAPGGEGRVFLI